jgi:hypothetical protein
MEFEKGDLVLATLPDDQGNAIRRAKFMEICDRDETVMVHGRKADAAWVQWLDGDDVDLVGQVRVVR